VRYDTLADGKTRATCLLCGATRHVIVLEQVPEGGYIVAAICACEKYTQLSEKAYKSRQGAEKARKKWVNG
jgi:hypothetical protein